MSELLSVLMEYADSTIGLSPAYREALEHLTACQKVMETGLDPQRQKKLDALLEAEHTLHAIDAEMVLRAGLAMGLELGELLTPR